MRPVAPLFSAARSGFPSIAASSILAFSSSATFASSFAFLAALSARILASSACSAASSSSSSSSLSESSESSSLASRSSLSLLSSSFQPLPAALASSSLASSSLYLARKAPSSTSAVCLSSLRSPCFSSSGSIARFLCLDHADLASACCSLSSDSRRAFLRSTTWLPLRNFSFVWEGRSSVATAPDEAPPADHPPSLDLPTAAFHVGLCAVVIFYCYY
mmetsp:Transcript_17884/g.49593  ORF Transcript_17884/g.49593 Transcript_17884/m.49593 type:complete len:218 (+) Transcript_17884:335-988(+)